MSTDRPRTTAATGTTTETRTVKGPGLARGPALIVGAILSAAGLILFLHAGDTPTGGFPDGDAFGRNFLGFESNGWTAWFTTAAGALLLFGAAQHLLAKAMSLIVGLALAAAAVIGLIHGSGVLGMAAANNAVELAWAIAAVILLVNVLLPRIERSEPAPIVDDDRRRREAVPTATEPGAVRREPEPVPVRPADDRAPTRGATVAPPDGTAPTTDGTPRDADPPTTEIPRRDEAPAATPGPSRDVPPTTPRTDDPPTGGATRIDR